MRERRSVIGWSVLLKLFYFVVCALPFAVLCLFLWYMGVSFGPGGTTAALELLMGVLLFGFGAYLVVRVVRGTWQNGWYALHRSRENIAIMVGGIILILFAVVLVGSFFGCLLHRYCPVPPNMWSTD